MTWFEGIWHGAALRETAKNDASTASQVADADQVARLAVTLRTMAERVSPEEFYWQDAHYDADSRQGRELLFLSANHEWVRATSETVDVSRSDSIQTEIKVDIDLGRITHEAFRGRTGRVWLPVTILPPQPTESQAAATPQQRLRRPHPDPFATVADATGQLLPVLPDVDLRHQISAAMAEIIVNMAVAHWPGPKKTAEDASEAKDPPVATRDQRLLLSAAIYRMLGRNVGAHAGSADSGPVIETPRITAARHFLLLVIDAYIDLLVHRAGHRTAQFAPLLAWRAVKVLQALDESVMIVVPVRYDTTPTVLTVRIPARPLRQGPGRSWFRPRTWIIRPTGHLEIDALLPTADADRQIELKLPDGVSLARPADPLGRGSGQRPRGTTARLDVVVTEPPSLEDLSASMEQVLGVAGSLPGAQDPQGASVTPLLQSFIDLARVKAAIALDTLRHYEGQRDASRASVSAGSADESTASEILKKLATELANRDACNRPALASLEGIWSQFRECTRTLLRRTSMDLLSPRTAVARADVIEDLAQRAIPTRARLNVDVAVDDRDYFSIARTSGVMSLILMLAVFFFLIGWRMVSPAPEVLAIVLTLFAAIQAGRIERPDRSTLRGRLSAIGTYLIAISMFPPVTLAIALAFRPGGWVPETWTGACVLGQCVILIFMRYGPLTPAPSPRIGHPLTFQTDQPDYSPFEALRSGYWRSTTADALMIGRMAYGYVIWQHTEAAEDSGQASPQLRPLLTWPDPTGTPDEASSVLALLRSGTLRQATTFVVFRGKRPKWPKDADTREIDLDPDRLVPMDSITSTVDVFVGTPRSQMLAIAAHPLFVILQKAANKLIVLDTQLPVPPPVPRDGNDRLWARVRVALRDKNDIRRLRTFLEEIHAYATQPDSARYVVAVQSVTSVRARVISAPASDPTPDLLFGRDGAADLVLDEDLDVVKAEDILNENADARTWRLVVMCADARSNIDYNVIKRLAEVRPGFQLAGLTYALLHGMAVIVLLAHEPERLSLAGPTTSSATQTATVLERELRAKGGLAKLQLLRYEELCRTQLGQGTDIPLLRVRFRSQDRPGVLANAIDWIKQAMSEESPSISPGAWSVPYALIQVVSGRLAVGHLTIRLRAGTEQVKNWNPVKVTEIERKVANLATPGAATSRPPIPSDDDQQEIHRPVISIGLITKPPEQTIEAPRGAC